MAKNTITVTVIVEHQDSEISNSNALVYFRLFDAIRTLASVCGDTIIIDTEPLLMRE